MRILITTIPGLGHFHPLVPIADALQTAGHEIVVVSSNRFREEIVRAGFPALAAGVDWLESDVASAFPEIRAMTPREKAGALVRLFKGRTALAMALDVLPVIRELSFDAVVHGRAEFGGPMAAECVGIPNIAVGNGVMCGVPPDPQDRRQLRCLFLDSSLPSFHVFDPVGEIPTTRAIRFWPFEEASVNRDLEAFFSTRSHYPTAYFTLGTVFNGAPDVYSKVVEALATSAINVVISTGDEALAEKLGDVDRGIFAGRYLPQNQVLAQADIVVSHGGYNTMMCAIHCGLPQLVLAIAADHPYNGRRVAAAGAGLTVAADRVTSEDIRFAIDLIMSDSTFRLNSERLREEMMTMPGIESAVVAIEALVESHASAQVEKTILEYGLNSSGGDPGSETQVMELFWRQGGAESVRP